MSETLSLSWWGALKRRCPMLGRLALRKRTLFWSLLPWALLLAGFLWINHRQNAVEAHVAESEPLKILERLERIDAQMEEFIARARAAAERKPK